MESTEQLRQLEESLLSGSLRRNVAEVAPFLAEDFREFGRSGTAYTKSEILAFLEAEEEIRVVMKDFACTWIADDVALLTYRSEREDGDSMRIAALRSSLWVRRDVRWQMLFHQGTPVKS
jgi:hypothetical protein